MRLMKTRKLFALSASIAMVVGLTSVIAPASAETTVTTDEVADLASLWAQGNRPFVPALSAGPEVGWNAGLEGLRPPAANYFRLWDMKVAWRDVNPAPGVFNWSILDRRVAQVESWGAKPIMVLGLTPQWAATDPNAGDPRWGAGTASPPADMNSWRAYVRALVQRYGSRIGAYETWNEANLQTFWTGTPAQMADMVDIAQEEIGNTAVTLAPSVTTRLVSGARFTADLVSELKPTTLNALDGWSIHTYPAADAGPTTAQACAQRVDDIINWQRALIDAGKKVRADIAKPMWDTEVNFGLAGPGPRPKTAWSDADGAALMTCSYQDSRALGIAVTVWYQFTAENYDLLGVQMNPGTPAINAAWAALPNTVGVTNPWIPDLSQAIEKTIVIKGERLNKRMVQVTGVTTGLPEGTKLRPWIRFPGQVGYTEGASVIRVQADGTVRWERRTGKKMSVYLRTDDRSIQSERVSIPGR